MVRDDSKTDDSDAVRVHTVTINLAGSDTAAIEAWLASLALPPLDEIPMARSHSEIVAIVRDTPMAAFRIEDDPFVIAIWQSIESAAIVYTLWRRTLHSIDVLMPRGAHLPALLQTLLSDAEIQSLSSGCAATFGRFVVRESSETLAGLLGFVGYVPVWFELHADN